MTEHSIEGLATYLMSIDKLRNKGTFPMTEMSRMRSSLPVEVVHAAVKLLVDRGDLLQHEQDNGTLYYSFPIKHVWLRRKWRNELPWDDTQWTPTFY